MLYIFTLPSFKFKHDVHLNAGHLNESSDDFNYDNTFTIYTLEK